ncbi:MAG: aldehyde dehydrogenase (NADP(+)) [Chitinophagaceae bacterium BSSC1]|nr:MAG: aldehyde dehydrogenase (NADP(+)) [Chitinophagaceae bacterium BSSC1]
MNQEIQLTSLPETALLMNNAKLAFPKFQAVSDIVKADFLDSIALEIEALGEELLHTTMQETNLPLARLTGERGRTTMQLRMFAQMLRDGHWVEASIDHANAEKTPPKPDLRKMLVGIGPVVVFGASNFPYAYSTAGGDTASALAAGCPVVVKAHPAHLKTSQLIAGAIQKAAVSCQMPDHVFQHTASDSFETGKALVQDPNTAAVGFTGSYSGGRALYDYAAARKNPIPVFSEMGSTNPVLLLPDTLSKNAVSIAKQYAGSINLGVGQFCTNPGILLGIASDGLNEFIEQLVVEMNGIAPATMLHKGILVAYENKAIKALSHQSVEQKTLNTNATVNNQALPILATVSGEAFIQDPLLHEEVFGPYALVVQCRNLEELTTAWQAIAGQLTTTLMGTDQDFSNHPALISMAPFLAGRVLFNGVPTGVDVSASMVHGGPFPASTDGRFTAVGINAVKRWVRPVSFQNCPAYLLPAALRDENPLGILRMVDGKYQI